MRYDAVVFDADGVLCEPTARPTLHDAISRALDAHGVTDAPTAALDELMGTTPRGLRSVCSDLGVDDVAAFWHDRDRHASAAQRAAIRRGKKSLYDDVDAVLELSVPVAVVSNNQQATVSFLLEYTGYADRFDPVIGRAPTLEDVGRKKPAPDFLERALEELDAERPLFVGDSNVDLEAAAAAGIDAAFVRRDHRRGYDLVHEPTHELSSLAELPALLRSGVTAADD